MYILQLLSEMKIMWNTCNKYIYKTFFRQYILKLNKSKVVKVTGKWEDEQAIHSNHLCNRCNGQFSVQHNFKVWFILKTATTLGHTYSRNPYLVSCSETLDNEPSWMQKHCPLSKSHRVDVRVVRRILKTKGNDLVVAPVHYKKRRSIT